MMTLATVRDALRSSDPYTEMDRLVRAEMMSGRKVQDIYDTLFPLWNDVRGSEGLTKDSEEAFLGTLDALTGDCDPDQCYEDPPNTALPTEEEIAQLPRWARVAFAARCAWRAFPLFTHAYATVPPGAVYAVVRLIGLAESAAWEAEAHAPEINDALHAAEALLNEYPETPPGSLAAVAAAESIFGTVRDAHRSVVEAARSATDEGLQWAAWFRRDFDALLHLSEWQHWNDDAPVSQDVFGPLWPEGAPVRWLIDPSVAAVNELVPVVLVKDGVTRRIVRDELLNVFNAVNRYYIARTGQRLTLEGDLPLLLAALVPEGSAT